MFEEVVNRLEENRIQPMASKDTVEFLSLFCEDFMPLNALEIGTLYGYSALFLSKHSKELTCIELDPFNFIQAKNNFLNAGVSNIKLLEGDALKILKKLETQFDLIFIDLAKKYYLDVLKLCLPLLSPRGVIFVDNTISHKDKLKDFFFFVEKSDLFYFELEIGKGLMIISKV